MGYNANDIETLEFKQAVRKRIEMYMGSADNQGVLQCVREIISNSIDEFSMGYGQKIIVHLTGNTITIADEGRGCPFGTRADGTEAMEAIFMSAHSGGKFSSKTYQSVIGMNGIGGKGVALSSEHFSAISWRDGKRAVLEIKKGDKVSFEVEDSPGKKTGTTIVFKPDQEVYKLEEIKISFEDIKEMCKNWSYLNKGLIFELKHFAKDEIKTLEEVTYFSKNGIADLLKQTVKNPLHPAIHYSLESDGIFLEVAMQWTKGKEQSFVFTNGLHNINGGTSLTGAKRGITRTLNNLVKEKFKGDMARTGLMYIINAKIPHASFSDQTKTKVNNPELATLADRAVTESLKKYAITDKNNFEKIISFLQKEKKAEAAAEKARQAVLNHTKQITDSAKKKVLMPDKLKDAEKLGEDSVLLLVEGNSAASSIANARNYEKYGILALRGKIINALSNPIEDVLANEEVKMLLMALGVSINKYNSKKLRYGKIGICVDADDDGCHIALLIMALLYRLIPKFIEEGRLYWLKTPLFRVVKGNQREYYFSEEELKNGIKGAQTRYKGLAELSTDDAKTSMFNEKHQRLEQIEWDKEGAELLQELMGEDVAPRKEFIFNEIDFSKYGEV